MVFSSSNLIHLRSILSIYIETSQFICIGDPLTGFYKYEKLVLILFFPMFPVDPPEHIRKPDVFWCFQGDQKEHLEEKGQIG